MIAIMMESSRIFGMALFFFEIFSWGFFRPYSNPDFAPLEAVESNHVPVKKGAPD
jgi:hypothetical protein